MPTYTYRCPECKFTIDATHKVNDVHTITCSQCMQSNMNKIPSLGTNVHFKGSGFYETDYKKK